MKLPDRAIDRQNNHHAGKKVLKENTLKFAKPMLNDIAEVQRVGSAKRMIHDVNFKCHWGLIAIGITRQRIVNSNKNQP